jgi:hypothetical protein
VLINFDEDFANAEKFFGLPGVRRALIAYWAEALADLRQRDAKSVYARYHSYDAVSQLLKYKRATQNVLVADFDCVAALRSPRSLRLEHFPAKALGGCLRARPHAE